MGCVRCSVFVFLRFSEFFTCINLQYFSVKMLIILSLAVEKQKELYQLPLWLWASQAFEPVELHKLTNSVN